MFYYTKGDILYSSAEALVNTVNTIGVMGKGIALQFKEAFPINHKRYLEACKAKELEPGNLLIVRDSNLLIGDKVIVNFPTKKHWRHPSKYEYIQSGLITLRKFLEKGEVKNIAIPPLGCGQGGLNWLKVRPMIEDALIDLPVDIYIYEPINSIKEILQKTNTNKSAKLTPARAQLLYALFAFESFGEYSSLFAANKLAYFLQRMGQPLRLDFKPHLYGPYSIGVEKVLYALNGFYLKGLEQGSAKPFEPLKLDYSKWEDLKGFIENELGEIEIYRLKKLFNFLNGFTSELSLEILATTDYILNDNPSFSLDQVMDAIWTTRKKEIFRKEYVRIAYEHIIKNRESFETTLKD